ncbi:MAG: hypothetical protein SPE33_10745 [[Pasteurella] aerogenes]|nr:hypothetical protein [[Pasteurella] aerogenes]
MKCKTAKEFLRPMAIEHYITNWNSNLFIFMSLYSDEEPYPIEDLVEVQKSRVALLMTDFDRLPTAFLETELLFAKKMLTQIEKRAKEIAKVKQ